MLYVLGIISLKDAFTEGFVKTNLAKKMGTIYYEILPISWSFRVSLKSL